jgi:hypothetical protein
VLKKTSAYTGLVIVTAAGALLASSPAYALDSLARGGSSSHHHHRSHHRNRNWNGHRHHGRIFIRIYIYNKNNNRAIAVARPEQHRRRAVVLRDSAPFRDDPEVRGGRMDRRTPAAASQEIPASETPASTDESPASANQAPVNTGTTPVDQGGAGNTPGAVGAPGAGRAASSLDEGATGNVSP